MVMTMTVAITVSGMAAGRVRGIGLLVLVSCSMQPAFHVGVRQVWDAARVAAISCLCQHWPLSFLLTLSLLNAASTISLMIQDMSDVKGKQSGVRMVTMRRGLLPDPQADEKTPGSCANDAARRRQSQPSSHRVAAGGSADKLREDRSELVSLEEEGLLDAGSSDADDDEDDEDGDDDAFDLTSMDVAGDGSEGRGSGPAQGMRSEMVRCRKRFRRSDMHA